MPNAAWLAVTAMTWPAPRGQWRVAADERRRPLDVVRDALARDIMTEEAYLRRALCCLDHLKIFMTRVVMVRWAPLSLVGRARALAQRRGVVKGLRWLQTLFAVMRRKLGDQRNVFYRLIERTLIEADNLRAARDVHYVNIAHHHLDVVRLRIDAPGCTGSSLVLSDIRASSRRPQGHARWLLATTACSCPARCPVVTDVHLLPCSSCGCRVAHMRRGETPLSPLAPLVLARPLERRQHEYGTPRRPQPLPAPCDAHIISAVARDPQYG